MKPPNIFKKCTLERRFCSLCSFSCFSRLYIAMNVRNTEKNVKIVAWNM